MKSHALPHHLIWKQALTLGMLLALSIFVKAGVWQLQPQVFNDSPGYMVPALNLLEGRGYGVQENGFRTPTYPLFLALVLGPFDHTHLAGCQDAHRAVCIGNAAKTADGQFGLRMIEAAQILLGLLTVALLFSLGWRLTRNIWIALLFGAGYALNPATAFWEISILTETLTTFLLTLSVYLTVREDRINGRTALGLGVTLGALALCHQLFIAYWVLPAGFLLLRMGYKSGLAHALSHVAPVLLIPLFAVGSWSTFNYLVNGYFTPSTLSGYVMIQMVAPVVEHAPEDDEKLTEIYVGYRDAMIAETGSYSGAIFRAWKDMLKASNLTWSELSRKLTTLSLSLIVAYPSSYLQVAQEGGVRFWGFAFYHYDPVPSGPGQWMLWFTDATWQQLLTVLFWISPLVLGIVEGIRRRMHADTLPLAAILFMILTVWMSAVIVALTNFQDNARMHTYALPLQYGTIVFMIWAVGRTLRRNELIDTAPRADSQLEEYL